jgi:hypothetical protein
MLHKTYFLREGSAAVLLLLLTAAVVGADDNPPRGKDLPDPPGTTIYMGQLRALFDAWDLNGDGYLDKEELAKAFRGPKAKPFDYVRPSPADKGPAKDDKTDENTAVTALTAVATAATAAFAEDLKDQVKDDSKYRPADSSSTKKPDYAKYPDYNFLVALDQDNDEKVSRKEFMSWARDYAVQLKQQADVQKKILRLQQKLANAKAGSKEYKALQRELKREQAALDKVLNKLSSQVKAFDKALQKSMQSVKR